MAKFSHLSKLSPGEKNGLLLELCQAIASLKNLEEAAHLLKDLLSSQEIEMIAKRLKAARFLIQGLTYQEIQKKLKMSPITIARVNTWLSLSGEGYRLVVKRAREPDLDRLEKEPRGEPPSYFGWQGLKRRYPMYFWPELLLKEIIKEINERQRKKLISTLKIIKKSNQKFPLYRQLEKLLKQK